MWVILVLVFWAEKFNKSLIWLECRVTHLCLPNNTTRYDRHTYCTKTDEEFLTPEDNQINVLIISGLGPIICPACFTMVCVYFRTVDAGVMITEETWMFLHWVFFFWSPRVSFHAHPQSCTEIIHFLNQYFCIVFQ